MSQPAMKTIAGRLDFSPGIRWATCWASVAIRVDCISACVVAVAVSDAQQLGLTRACNHSLARPRDHVHLAADAELSGEVDAGLDREAGVGQQQAFVVRLEVLEVLSVAVQLCG